MMSLPDKRPSSPSDAAGESRVPASLTHLARSRTYMLVAVALVVIVITVASLASSGVPRSLAAAQHRYLTAITPVEEADVIFNGGSSTSADHSPASTRALVQALGDEFSELGAVKWPKDAALDVHKLAGLTQSEMVLLQTFERASNAKRTQILMKQATVQNAVESENESILKELRLPLPTNAAAPVTSSKAAP
jgi:hypothetical protein